MERMMTWETNLSKAPAKAAEPKKLIFILFLSIFFLSCVTGKKQTSIPPVDSLRVPTQTQSKQVTDKQEINRNEKTFILLKSVWGDTIGLKGCVGIFAGENSGNLRYKEAVSRIDKALGINIKKMSFDEEISEYLRTQFFSNGIQIISLQKSIVLQKSVGFYKAGSSDKVHIMKASKIGKTNWMGKAQLHEEKLDMEFLKEDRLYNAHFDITYAQQEKPKIRWSVFDENQKVIEKDETIRLRGNINNVIGYLCRQQGLRYIMPQAMCGK
ncbi:MAG: hypothetical protein ABIC39_00905 [Pseudomonadota bacterium]